MTALGLLLTSGDMYRRTSYPLLFCESNAETLLMYWLFAAADPCRRSATCVAVSQVRLLLVSLELAMVEIEVESNVTTKTMTP